ncbi:MAG: AIM24 family protein [Actinomycetota bacterium]|nr:AIM24 family protein [Actinomycetota bacterium]
MASPVSLPTRIPDGTGPGLAFRIEGELVPALHMSLSGEVPILHEHHVLLWKQPQIDITIAKLGGIGKSLKRMIAGMPIFFTQATGRGEFALSRDTPGQLVQLPLAPGQEILAREHAFLCSANADYTFERAGGVGSMLFGSQGFFIDRFTGLPGGGMVFLHAHGNAQEFVLQPGEVIDVEPGAWLYRDKSVGYTQQVFGLKTGMFSGGGNLIWNRFTGPGRVGIQSGYFSGEAGAAVAGASAGRGGGLGGMATGGVLGAALGSILND